MYLFRSYASASFMSLSGNMGRNVFTSLSLRRENRAPASFSVNCRRISRSVSMWVILAYVDWNECAKYPGRSVSRFAVLKPSDDRIARQGYWFRGCSPRCYLSCLFLSRSRISVSNCTSAGGAAGAGASSFFFSCNLLNRRISRKIENEIIRKSSVVCRKLP